MSGTSPLRVAVFGAGPSGFYAVADLLKQTTANGQSVAVDLFDRLPTPYGLVRGGVAPDHQKIKAVIRQYDKTANRPGFRFFGNVTFGTDLTIDDMLTHYHQVLFTTGAESDRHGHGRDNVCIRPAASAESEKLFGRNAAREI